MNQRVEPRFKTDKDVTLQFANKAEQFPARIVDVSGLGFRIFVDQPIAVGETLQINIEDRRLLVAVRHCGPTDNGFFVGVERIDKWLPGEAPDDAALGRPQISKDVDPLRVMALRNQFPQPSAAAAAGKGSRRGLMLGGIAAVIGLSVLALIWGGVRGSGHTVPAAIAPVPVVEKQAAKAEPETAVTKKPVADKTPVPVVKPVVATSAPQPVAKVVTPAIPAVPPQVAVKTPAAAPVPTVAPGALLVTLHASELSWVDACADGRVVFSKAFTGGETGVVKFVKVATVRSGNAGGLAVGFGAKPAERMGEKGVIHMWKFTPQGREEVPPGSPSACVAH